MCDYSFLPQVEPNLLTPMPSSVPAVWSDAAKDATLRASKITGLFPITLIKEPEAAALHTTHAFRFALNFGDAFVICDARGNTVTSSLVRNRFAHAWAGVERAGFWNG